MTARDAASVARRAGRTVCIALAIGLALGTSSIAQVPISEDQVKAGYLFNLVKFVEWPKAPGDEAGIVIAIVGTDSLSRVIEDRLEGRSVAGRVITVKTVRRLSEATDAHILYIALSEEDDLPYIMRELRGRRVLTVGDGARFAERGCVLAFVTEQSRVRFHVNLSSADSAGLKISSQLLKLATQVYQ